MSTPIKITSKKKKMNHKHRIDKSSFLTMLSDHSPTTPDNNNPGTRREPPSFPNHSCKAKCISKTQDPSPKSKLSWVASLSFRELTPNSNSLLTLKLVTGQDSLKDAAINNNSKCHHYPLSSSNSCSSHNTIAQIRMPKAKGKVVVSLGRINHLARLETRAKQGTPVGHKEPTSSNKYSLRQPSK